MDTTGRIAKFIATAGVCSRRQAEKMIADGRVKLDGKIITTPAINVGSENIIEIDNKIIQTAITPRIWLYYKPVGLITTHNDPQNRPTIFDSLKNLLPRVISVGRLDLNSEGLLLLTNSGALAREFELPQNKLERVYKVRAHGTISNLINYIAPKKCHQITIDNVTYRPKKIKIISKGTTNSWFEVTLTEGKNREIRKIFEYFSLKVNRLIRVKYGKYELGSLTPGEFKEVHID
ncbi:MAG: pseudouridine synthase [Rickettsiaceae bacterium]